MRWVWGLLPLLVAAGAAVALYLYLTQPNKQLAQHIEGEGKAAVAAGQAGAALDAGDIAHKGEARERGVNERKEKAVARIRSALGADTPLPDDLRRRINDGMRDVDADPERGGRVPLR